MARRRDPRRADAASRPRVASYRQLDSVQGLQPRRVGLRSNIKGFNYSLVSCIRSSLNISCASFPSYRRKPVGGFTFEVQQVTGKDLSRSFVVKTFSWSV